VSQRDRITHGIDLFRINSRQIRTHASDYGAAFADDDDLIAFEPAREAFRVRNRPIL
jgi:hypothetical protein